MDGDGWRWKETDTGTGVDGSQSIRECRNVRRILVRGVNAPLPPEAKKILKI